MTKMANHIMNLTKGEGEPEHQEKFNSIKNNITTFVKDTHSNVKWNIEQN